MTLGNLRRALVLAIMAALPCAQVAGFELTEEKQDEIRRGTQGAFFHVPELTTRRQRLPIIPVTILPLPGTTLLFSDRPEYLGTNDGVAVMEDIKAGGYRLYVYHVPGTNQFRKIVSVAVQNKGTKVLHLQFDRYAFPKPGTDYPAMGVAGLMEFFGAHTLPAPLSIPPGAAANLDQRLENTAAMDPQLVHTLYEFHIDQPARIAVLQKDTNQASLTPLDLLSNPPPQMRVEKLDGAGRGLFAPADLAVTNEAGSVIDSADGVQRLILADGRLDKWLTGTDGLAANSIVTNKGNYGVIYHVRLAYKASDGQSMAMMIGSFSRRSGGGTRPMAALKISDGIWKGGWVGISGKSEDRGAVALVQKFSAPAAGTTNYIEITYSPPGGSSLPIPILFVPFKP
jgi:hypothetical protein